MPEFEGRLQAVWGLIVILRSRRDGILEYYWGEHIHLGYYSEEERARGYKKKDFKQAKLDFVDEMLAWSGARQPQRILDVGCGIGGTSRHLAATFPHAAVQGALAPLCSGKYPACSALLWAVKSLHAGMEFECIWYGAPAGITLSPKQVERATELARQRGLANVSFQACALPDLIRGWPCFAKSA